MEFALEELLEKLHGEITLGHSAAHLRKEFPGWIRDIGLRQTSATEHIDHWDTTILVSSVAAGIANAMTAQAAVSRVLFAMARDAQLPAPLAMIHPRFQTPYVSALLVGVISLIVGLFFAHRIADLTRIVNFGALTGFVLLHLSVINYYFIRKRTGRWIHHLLFPLVGLTVISHVLYETNPMAKIMAHAGSLSASSIIWC